MKTAADAAKTAKTDEPTPEPERAFEVEATEPLTENIPDENATRKTAPILTQHPVKTEPCPGCGRNIVVAHLDDGTTKRLDVLPQSGFEVVETDREVPVEDHIPDHLRRKDVPRAMRKKTTVTVVSEHFLHRVHHCI